MSAVPALGFSDPAIDSQRVFRSVMDALARPGSIRPLATDLQPPAPLTPELAAVALTLADHEAPLWLDAALAAEPQVAAYLRFHAGAAITADPKEAAFALVAEPAGAPPLDRFALGTPEYPDRSTTVVLAVPELSNEGGFVLEGPGIRERARLAAAALPGRLAAELAANRRLFPLGVDCLLVAPGRIAGLPRTTELAEAA